MGPNTTHGVDLLTEMYVIYTEMNTSHRVMLQAGHTSLPKMGPLGPRVLTLQMCTNEQKARKYPDRSGVCRQCSFSVAAV